jgi:hypothetical protein
MIPPVSSDNHVPEGARCQEASFLSRGTYIPCNAPATKVIFHDKDRRGYYMCNPCADHNVRNRGGRDVTAKPPAAARGRSCPAGARLAFKRAHGMEPAFTHRRTADFIVNRYERS